MLEEELLEATGARLDALVATAELLLMSELGMLDAIGAVELAWGALEPPPPPPPQPIIDANKPDNSSVFIIFMVSL